MQWVSISGGIYQVRSLKYCIELQFYATVIYLTATGNFSDDIFLVKHNQLKR